MELKDRKNFDKVYAHLKNKFNEQLLDERGTEFQESVHAEYKAKFDRLGNILKQKLEVQLSEKLNAHPIFKEKLTFESWVGYNKKYIWTHPWKIIERSFEEVKWAWQRVFRGWDDRVIWSIDYYLSKYIPQWISVLKETKNGIPMSMYDETDFDEDFSTSKEGDEKALAKYNDILDKIISTFQEYEKLDNVYEPEEKEPLQKKFNEGFDLFRDFFDTLWD